MSFPEAHPSQDILAELPATQTVAEIPVRVSVESVPELVAAVQEDILASVSASESDPLAQAQEQLNDPLAALTFSREPEIVTVAAAAPSRLRALFVDKLGFLFNYACVTAIIFVVLLGTLNWSAYSALAKSWLNPQELENANASISSALLAADVTAATAASGAAQAATVTQDPAAPADAAKDVKRAAVLEGRLKQDKIALKRNWLSADTFVKNAGELAYNVEITPYDNRIIIPKLGKNIPLVNVDNHKVGSPKDWNKIFEKELEKGIIKYPGSANPGEAGNAFVFGHSSNFPWIKGDYNDVFALLDKLEYGDEVTVFFKQKKYVYVIREKHIIKPGYVNAMKGKEEAKQMTLMTCWPIGTTLNRLIVMGDLKETAVPAAGGIAKKDGTLISMK